MTDDTFETLMERVAAAAAANGLSLDAFMNAACVAYMQHHPQMIEMFQARQLLEQLHVLREAGRLPSA